MMEQIIVHSLWNRKELEKQGWQLVTTDKKFDVSTGYVRMHYTFIRDLDSGEG
jgi:hypothetical protein